MKFIEYEVLGNILKKMPKRKTIQLWYVGVNILFKKKGVMVLCFYFQLQFEKLKKMLEN